jgi:hypothetical protein
MVYDGNEGTLTPSKPPNLEFIELSIRWFARGAAISSCDPGGEIDAFRRRSSV